MEETYRTFSDRINFIWVYGKEAHPGTECWDHPVTVTKTMPERAQRGRWMKYDPEPDLVIPMMIDFIEHDTHSDEAIRSTYGGGRPNAGYLIDCDGTVLEQHDWAWSSDGTAPGRRRGELLDFGDLAASLERYLDDPPACYHNERPYLPPPTTSPPTATADATTVPTSAPTTAPTTAPPVEATPTRPASTVAPPRHVLLLPLLYRGD